MKNLFLIVGVSLYLCLAGCASKSGLFSPDILSQRALTYTKKAEIYNSLEIKASAVITYLNPLLKKYEDKYHAYFLVSLFIDNDSSDIKKQGLHNHDIQLTLNSQSPLTIKDLKADDDLIKIAPVKNMWSHYYLVTFEKPLSKEMKMLLKSQRYGSSSLIFEAE